MSAAADEPADGAAEPEEKVKKPPSGSRREIIMAAIVGAAAVFGALAGGWASYHGNRTLEQDRSADAARGGARVLQAQLASVDARLAVMVKAGKVSAPPGGWHVTVGLDDEKLIASNLTPEQWAKVSAALAAVDTLDQDDGGSRPRVYKTLDATVRKGVSSLDSLTGQ